MDNSRPLPSFDNTEAAFASKSNSQLKHSYRIFKLLSYSHLSDLGSRATQLALDLGLPIEPLVRATVFKQFVGGESLHSIEGTIKNLAKSNIKTILDYGVEAKSTEADFVKTTEYKLHSLDVLSSNANVPFISLKITAIARFALLERIHAGKELNQHEQEEYEKVRARMHHLCQKAHETGKSILFDAEESWIQRPLDDLINEMMLNYNTERAVAFNTYQLYRNDRREHLMQHTEMAKAGKYILGAKLVRGAYMEKERERAAQLHYPSPIHVNKEAVDKDYQVALDFCLNHLDSIVLCIGTHNEASCLYACKRMNEMELANDHPNIFFSQLYGMGEHITYNLAKEGYNATKWVTYGPVKEVMPYLIRRAQENTSVSGQVGRELSLLGKEMKRRRLL
ncbi:MAG: proline dehydrogenase family protein [Chitinophagales bacterium]|nr:proline dehydrogenase family protein [Chitinophagales bacterium]